MEHFKRYFSRDERVFVKRQKDIFRKHEKKSRVEESRSENQRPKEPEATEKLSMFHGAPRSKNETKKIMKTRIDLHESHDDMKPDSKSENQSRKQT